MIRKITLLSLLLLVTSASFADVPAKPYCTAYNGNGYCAYVGKVAKAYVNDTGTLLLYYESAMIEGAEDPHNYDGDITKLTAAAYLYDDNPEFGKMLYSTLLTAQARGAVITVQMRGVSYGTSGYPLIDRIWINE